MQFTRTSQSRATLPAMTSLHLRRAALPFTFATALGLGVWLWLRLGDFSLAHCPPERVWYGLASGDRKCNWPLAVYLAKDMIGAALTGALPVLLCAAVAPARKAGVAGMAAALVCALALLFLLGGSHHLRPASLLAGVGMALALSSWLAAGWVMRYAPGPSRAICARPSR